MKYLLDSNIIIYYLSGNQNIQSFLEKYKIESSISIISYYEILNYDFTDEEEVAVRRYLEDFEIINLSKNIINKALQNRKNRKIKMADNFIISTAQIFNLYLVTRNTKDFSHFSHQLINPFDAS